jgi:hypothetical protein
LEGATAAPVAGYLYFDFPNEEGDLPVGIPTQWEERKAELPLAVGGL